MNHFQVGWMVLGIIVGIVIGGGLAHLAWERRRSFDGYVQRPPRPMPPTPVPPEWRTPGAHGFTPPPPAAPRPHDSQEMRWLGELSKVKVEPGDVFVMHVDRILAPGQRERMQALWKEHMGDAKVLVMDGGVRLGVVQMPSSRQCSPECINSPGHTGPCNPAS